MSHLLLKAAVDSSKEKLADKSAMVWFGEMTFFGILANALMILLDKSGGNSKSIFLRFLSVENAKNTDPKNR